VVVWVVVVVVMGVVVAAAVVVVAMLEQLTRGEKRRLVVEVGGVCVRVCVCVCVWGVRDWDHLCMYKCRCAFVCAYRCVCVSGPL
jgi:hypothetical protein